MSHPRISPRPALQSLFLLAAGLLLTTLFLSRFEPAGRAALRLAGPLAAALVVLLAGLGTGWAALAAARRFPGRSDESRGDPPGPGIGALLLLGTPLFGTLVALAAWPGWRMRLLVLALTAVAAATGLALLPFRLPLRLPPIGPREALLLAPFLAVPLLLALGPVASPDELIYKLAVPKEWSLAGGMIELPLCSHSYFATALAGTSLAALELSGGLAAKIVHLGLFLASLAAIRRLAGRLFAPAAPLAAILFAATPALAIVGGWAWSEWSLLGLAALALDAQLDLVEGGEPDAPPRLALALGGLLAVKSSALALALPLLLVAAIRFVRRLPPRPLRIALSFAATLALSGGFFYFRNFLWTGSPIAPFGLPDAPAVEHFRSGGALGPLEELLRGYDLFHPGMADDSLGILLPLAVLLSPFALRRGRGRLDLLLVGAGALALLLPRAPMSRLLTPALLPLGLLGAVTVARIASAAPPLLRRLLATAALVPLAAQLALILWLVAGSYDPLPVVAGLETDSQQLARTRSYSRAYDWIAGNTPAHAVVLLLGENRPWHLERRALAGGNLDGPRIARWLGGADGPEALGRRLAEAGATHVLLHPKWIALPDGAHPSLSPLEKEYVLELPAGTFSNLRRLLEERARKRYDDGEYLVFELAKR
jgi:hypothetical protein